MKLYWVKHINFQEKKQVLNFELWFLVFRFKFLALYNVVDKQYSE